MEKEPQQNDLEALSQAWSEKIRGIRDAVRKKGFSEEPDDAAEFQGENQEVPALQEVPAARDDELFTESFHSTPVSQEPAYSKQDPTQSINYDTRHPKTLFSSFTLKSMIAGILLIALGVIGYGVFSKITLNRDLIPASAAAVEPKKTGDDKKQEDQLRNDPEPMAKQDQPVSMKLAQDYYDQGQYDNALTVYDALINNLDQAGKNAGLDAFLSLKKALCMISKGDTEQGIHSLKKLAQHRLPVVRALSTYCLCLEEYNQKQYLSARTDAYKTLALLDAAGDAKPFASLRRNCQYLAAEAVTHHVLMLLDGDSDLPADVWGVYDPAELNQMIEEQHPASFLASGAKELNKATLQPILDVRSSDSAQYWTILTKGAALDEIVSRFSANGDFIFTPQTQPALLNRPVYMFLQESTGQQALTAAAGCTGLVAAFDENSTVTIYDPVESSYTRQQILRLCDEAVHCWQQFLFTYHDDPDLANVFFLLGALKAEQGQTAEALGHYKMVANRFYQSKLAPAALVHSAALKTSLNDYAGAYSVLNEAVHQYPNYENLDTACLMLADTALQMDRKDEAANLYSKVYFINGSPQTRAAAALKAGQIHYQNANYDQAQKWLSRYFDLSPETQDSHYYQACLVLGLTWQAIGNTKSACEALQMSLSDQLSQEDYLCAVSTLVECSMKRGSYIAALNAINEASSRPFSRPQSVTLLLLRSNTLRSMGLTEQAITLLNDRLEYLVDDTLKTRVGDELSECYIQQGDYQGARDILMKMLNYTESDVSAQNTLLQLARVCAELNEDSQAINLCTKLLNTNPDTTLESQARTLLADIYRKQKNYDHAALSLLGQAR